MTKKIVYIILILLLSFPSFAQKTIKGKVFSEDNKPLVNATIILLHPVDSTMKHFGVSNKAGEYQVKSIRDGDYIMQFSYVGTQTKYVTISIPIKNRDDFGKTVLEWKKMDEVEVVAEYVPIRFRKDTVEFNANAFKTKPDAVVEDLLKKIPGIEVDNSGNIKAMGEDVQKVLVDGKEFFGNDKKVATKNLPSNAIEKVQVFDKKSYEAEFMEVDDGVRDRTINLELKEGAKAGLMGNVEASVGTKERYKLDGKLYRFTGSTQTAVLGMRNNINQFGFTTQDMGEYGKEVKGVNTTGAGGLNFSFSPEQFKRYYISYLGSHKKRELEEHTNAEYFFDKNSYQQSVDLVEENISSPHSFDFGIHHRFNAKNNIIISGNADIVSNKMDRLSETTSFNEFGNINELLSIADNSSEIFNGVVKGSYMSRLNEGRTQFKLTFNATFSDYIAGSTYQNRTQLFLKDTTILSNQYLNKDTDKRSISINPSFVQKIGKLWYISPNADIGIQNQIIDQEQGDLLTMPGKIDSLSPYFKRDLKHVKAGLSLKRSSVSSELNIGLNAAWNHFETQLWDDNMQDHGTYFNLLPYLMYDKRIRTGRRFRARYATSVNVPTAIQLLPVVNTTNPIVLNTGNRELIPELQHILFSELSIFDQYSFTSVFLRAGGTYTSDKISSEQLIGENLVKIYRPVNVPSDYTAFGYLSFSKPFRKIGIKTNLKINENWHKGMNYINSKKNEINSITHSIDFNIENHIKEKIDARLGTSIALTNTKFSTQGELNNLYFNTVYYANIDFFPSDKWSMGSTARITNYNSKNLNESMSIPLLDAEISYYFLKGNRGVLSLRGIDLLDKNTGFKQTSAVNYLMQVNSNTIGRYVMLAFKYRLTGQNLK